MSRMTIQIMVKATLIPSRDRDSHAAKNEVVIRAKVINIGIVTVILFRYSCL